jgi:L,D-peptidoglycan transpeptidase YkuD (ErfK/YbiS/YcfS/YnhG family)
MNDAVFSGAAAGAAIAPEKLACAQILLVRVQGAKAEVRCYDRPGTTAWRFNASLGIIPGCAGRNGISASKKEGDGCTPSGLFSLGHVFGINEKPETKMPYRRVTAESFWVDDPASPHYNTWVEGGMNGGWQSAERLSDYPREYAYAVVIEYNTADRIPGKGSAVFLHCGSKPTSGCIAVPEAELLKILRWLDPKKAPAILITDR